MGAAGEPALAQVRLKLSERVLQVLFPHKLHALGVKGGEAGGIGHDGDSLESW